MKVLVTGASGFLGRNLCVELGGRPDVDVIRFDRDTPARGLDEGLAVADVVFHLAGVECADNSDELHKANAELTRRICGRLLALGARPKIVFASSACAELDEPYGLSKRVAEESVHAYADKTGASGIVHRLKSVFGKWDRPGHHSAIATLCHQVANGLPVEPPPSDAVLDLTYVDDVIAAFLADLDDPRPGFRLAAPLPSCGVAVSEIVTLLRGFRDSRQTLCLPDFTRPFVRALYATYLAYLPPDGLAYGLDVKTDPRGKLAELFKQPCFGQIYFSRTRPGQTRGNHFHRTKAEKMVVVEGEAVIRFRQAEGGEVVEYAVRGEDFKVVDVPPGCCHSIENVGSRDLVTILWSSQVFTESHPDTVFLPVLRQGEPT